MTSSIYPLPVTGTAGTIPINNDIFVSDVAITSDMVKPGGGGILRLSFSLVITTSPAVIRVFNNGNLKGSLNADNSENLITNGFYRFDIDVEAGDNINMQSPSSEITAINFVRAHLVQFGA